MIDYDKLKIANSIIEKHKYPITLTMSLSTHIETADFCVSIIDHYSGECYGFDNIDNLIAKLQELTQLDLVETGYISEILEEVKPINGVLTLPAGDYIFKNGVTYKVKKIDKPEELTEPKPKYKVNDTIWFRLCDEISSAVISEVLQFSNDVHYVTNCGNVVESALYPTKAALIEAQIEYWQKLKLESMTPPFEGEAMGFNEAFKVCVGCKEPVSCCDCDIQRHQDQVDIDRCQHESDGYFYRENRKSSVPYNCDGFPDMKCNKCGEFYR
jgi:hypothetical protein